MSADLTTRTEAGAPKKWGAGVGGFLTSVVRFLSDTRAEMKKVTWPTRDELVKATRMILIFSVVLGLLIGWLDLILNKILIDGIALLSR